MFEDMSVRSGIGIAVGVRRIMYHVSKHLGPSQKSVSLVILQSENRTDYTRAHTHIHIQ